MKSIILFIVAIILFAILAPVGIVYKVVHDLVTLNWKKALTDITDMFGAAAICIDILGNVMCGELLNDTLTNKQGYKFGKIETVSYALGRNKARKKNPLTFTGRLLEGILDAIDPNHVEKAVKKKI